MMTSKELILERLSESGKSLACHELNITGHSENALASRLSELQREGKIQSRYREGFRYKEWFLPSHVFKFVAGQGEL